MADKLSDNEKTHEVMDALKEVLECYKRSHEVDYKLFEGPPAPDGSSRYITLHVRVPA